MGTYRLGRWEEGCCTAVLTVSVFGLRERRQLGRCDEATVLGRQEKRKHVVAGVVGLWPDGRMAGALELRGSALEVRLGVGVVATSLARRVDLSYTDRNKDTSFSVNFKLERPQKLKVPSFTM